MSKKKPMFILDISEEHVIDGPPFVTSTQMIVAKKRRGKSYLAQKQAEELLAAKQQIVALDPTGAWWGLRSSADGRAPGYPIAVFGGDHGDVPLDAAGGETLARAIVEEGFSAVVDLTSMRKGERIRFGADFLETLYRLNRSAMHLFVDEADVFAPQVTRDPQQARLLGATDELVRRGGIRGVGVTLITQRSQVVSKDVISQIDAMAVLQMNHPKDIDAVRDWVEANFDDEDRIEAMLRSLSRMPIGSAWYLNPEQDLFRQVKVKAKRTFDSGRTPKSGERITPPKALAPIDLERLGASMKAAVVEARANDPKALRARVSDLEAEIERARTSAVPALTPALVKRVEQAVERFDHATRKLQGECGAARMYVDEVRALLAKNVGLNPDVSHAPENIERDRVEREHQAQRQRDAKAHDERWQPRTAVPPNPHRPASTRDASGPSPSAAGDASRLEPRWLRILAAAAWWESIGVAIPSTLGVAFIAGYSPSSSSFEKARSALRSRGLVDYPNAGATRLTDAGRRAAPAPDVPASLAGLHDAIRAKLEPRQWRILSPLVDQHPHALDLGSLAAAADYEPTSSSFEKARGFLRSLGLVTYPASGKTRASDLLFPSGLR